MAAGMCRVNLEWSDNGFLEHYVLGSNKFVVLPPEADASCPRGTNPINFAGAFNDRIITAKVLPFNVISVWPRALDVAGISAASHM